MQIENISNKILFVGTITILPEETVAVPDKMAKTPALKAWEKAKMIRITEDKTPVKRNRTNTPVKDVEDAPVTNEFPVAENMEEDETPVVADEIAAPKKRGRKPANKE